MKSYFLFNLTISERAAFIEGPSLYLILLYISIKSSPSKAFLSSNTSYKRHPNDQISFNMMVQYFKIY